MQMNNGIFNPGIMPEVFNLHTENDGNAHYFCSEELLSTFVNHCDTQRLQMFSNHINQTVHLVNPEFPKVFSGFENQIGKYSIAYKKAKMDATIIAKIPKNACNTTYIIQYRDGTYDCVDYHGAINISEEYGYGVDDCLKDKNAGDKITEGDYFYKSANYDDQGNFGYGTNLKAVYMPWKGKTYEDAFVISESAAKKFLSYKCEKIPVSINTNDILLNLYGKDDGYSYQAMPKVGEHTKDTILVASRREDSQNVLYNFQLNKMRELDKNDSIYYTNGGIVYDIDVFSNVPLERLRARKNEFAQELADLYEQQIDYYTQLKTVLDVIIKPLTEEEYIATLDESKKKAYEAERKAYGHYYTRHIARKDNENKYTDALDYKWKVVHEWLDNKISWRYDGKRFDNIRLEFTVLKENPLTIGSKCTGRYGNKGVCSAIIPDEEMPFDPSTGIRADICLNPLGVVNRLNPAQLMEQFVNFISDHVLAEMKKVYVKGDLQSARKVIEKFEEYLSYINPEQAEEVGTIPYMSKPADIIDFAEDLIDNGLYIHEPPFARNTPVDALVNLFKEKPEWVERYHCQGIEKPIVIGDEYFIRLKHESSNKLSIRSTGMLNIKNQPAKSALKKEKKSLVNDNAIRIGEMETTNLQACKRPDLVSKLLRSYSTSTEDRENLIEALITADNPLNITVEDSGSKSITRQMLDKYLAVLGLELQD